MINLPKVPFKTPVDYFNEALKGDPDMINQFPLIQQNDVRWKIYDSDLHIYPYIEAIPAMLSMGCNNQCSFCPTAKTHKGKIHFGNPEKIIPYYEGRNVHFMDENFFRNDMDKVLPLLKKHRVTWLAMATAEETIQAFKTYGEKNLYDAGLRIVEVGLENVELCMKVPKEGIPHSYVEIYYLNMTFLPNETKQSLLKTGNWMFEHGLQRPIHFNNGNHYGLGQFYMPYEPESVKDLGIFVKSPEGRTKPTFIPYSFLKEEYKIEDMEQLNHFSQLAYDFKLFPHFTSGRVIDFVGDDYKKAMWMAQGFRTGCIK